MTNELKYSYEFRIKKIALEELPYDFTYKYEKEFMVISDDIGETKDVSWDFNFDEEILELNDFFNHLSNLKLVIDNKYLNVSCFIDVNTAYLGIQLETKLVKFFLDHSFHLKIKYFCCGEC